MPTKILMPSLSPTMVDGKLSKWLKKEGDVIKTGDIIAEIETDKATMEYESSVEGTLGKILVAEGSEGVAVNALIAVLLNKGETNADVDAFVKAQSANSTAPKTQTSAVEVKKEESKAPLPSVSSNTSSNSVPTPAVNVATGAGDNNGSKKIFITPLAKRIATEKNIDLSSLVGSGPNGRIIKFDVENFKAPTNTVQSANSNVPNNSLSVSGSFEDKQNSGIRKTIAKRLLESKITVPHYYLSVDCVMDDLMSAREKLNEKGVNKYKLSVNDFIVKAVALALQDNPQANTNWLGDTTRYFTSSDVAVAVATEGGLFTPVVKNAEKKGLVAISEEIKSLVKKAKEGKLQPSEYQGGSFSVSNLGMFGINEFHAIVNPPHSGILAVGATFAQPIVKNNQIVVGNVMKISLSADHRVLDGAVAAKFLKDIQSYLENPITMIV